MCVKSSIIPHLLQGWLILGYALYIGVIDILIIQIPLQGVVGNKLMLSGHIILYVGHQLKIVWGKSLHAPGGGESMGGSELLYLGFQKVCTKVCTV